MATPFLLSIDPKEVQGGDGLSLQQISYFGRVLIKVSTAAAATEFLNQNFQLLDVYVDATDVEPVDDVVDILNAGAAVAIVSLAQLKGLSQEQNLPSSRLVASVSSEGEVAELKNWIAEVEERKHVGVYTASLEASAVVKALGIDPTLQPVYRSFDKGSATLESLEKNREQGAVSVVSSTAVTVEKNADGTKIPAAQLLTSGAVSEKGTGLYATSVTDERGISLGLVWSSDESVSEALRTGTGVYQSRKRGLWYKGQSSGDTQELVRIGFDCDSDCFVFVVRQKGRGTASCFGPYTGLSRLQNTLKARKEDAPQGSYTARLFNEPKLIEAKIMEEAEELCQASSKEDVASEAADLLYFALTKCTAAGVSLTDIERNLDLKNLKVKRRKGDAKGPWAEKVGLTKTEEKPAAVEPEATKEAAQDERIKMKRYVTADTSQSELKEALQRPSQKSNETIMGLVRPIIEDVRNNGDSAVLKYTHKFEKATSLTSPILNAPFPEDLMRLPSETIKAIDVSYNNIRTFHAAQKEEKPLAVETMPGVVCSRFSRPIERVGLYVPGGTAVLPSTALMLGVPAMVAGCKGIVLASPPRSDGSISPEIVYIAHKVGAESIVLAGGAQAVAAMAYGTESVSKVDKILGPGNQFVTAAKMLVSNDTSAGVSIDMPAGPSEVLVIADKAANPAYVASDLLSQAEHGVDSQVILIAVDLNEKELLAIEDELHSQAMALPRVDIVKGAIDHSVSFVVKDLSEAMALSNTYAPEHLILQIQNPEDAVQYVQNAGSVFIGQWTPESVGDYSAGVNHSLPTYGYAKQYSGVNLASFIKHITSSNLTREGLRGLSQSVMQLASVEGLEAHKRAVSIRMDTMDK
ncbi:trifunctional histidinol dehydrogenase [Arachnomyces sp. PD_36]|nr:trifunctional histidinol dehydrogenase [Arachnomyces sp. PD_36]